MIMALAYGITYSIIQAAFIFALAPLVTGIMRKVKARFQGRIGAPIYQPYLDIAKLLMKGIVVSSTTSWVFIAAPILFFASIAIAAGLLPLFFPENFVAADLVLFIYIFAIGRFMSALAALDTGSAFGGIGASREMLYSALIEPAMFAAIIFLCVSGGSTGLVPLSAAASANLPTVLFSPAFWLAAAALLIVILAETGRLPFDNPATHLELTMVHEAMVLDYSGPLLALIEWANSAKIVVLFGVFVALFLPLHTLVSGNIFISAAVFAATVIALAIMAAAIESISPKWRLFKIPKLLTFSLVLSMLAFLMRVFYGTQEGDLTAILSFAMLVCALYFIFSATFRRRLELFIIQSAALALILAFAALSSGSAGAYWRLGSTLIFKVIILPWLLYRTFRSLAGDSKILLNADPLFIGSPLGVSGVLMLSGILILLSYTISSILGVQNQLMPVAFSIILIGGLIIATKTHVLLQLFGFLILENGLVLLPVVLSVEIPLLGEIVTLFDALTLVIVALVLVFKISGMVESLDSVHLNRLLEEK